MTSTAQVGRKCANPDSGRRPCWRLPETVNCEAVDSENLKRNLNTQIIVVRARLPLRPRVASQILRKARPQPGFSTAGRVRYALIVTYLILFTFYFTSVPAQSNLRQDVSLSENWLTVADDENIAAFNGFELPTYNVAKWKAVNVPHNWDGYEGYRRMRHGNRHGYAWYRKSFSVKQQANGKRFFLFFEGVGSYATVWLNGKQVGYHAGGRTTFTIDVTDVIKKNGEQNLLAVRADHPANIRDLPWVCGGCSDERGFSEGSQPMGIFRPVQLIITNDVRIEPFGVHIWNDTTVSTSSAQIYFETEIRNYSRIARNIVLRNRLLNRSGEVVAETLSKDKIDPSSTIYLKQTPPVIRNPKLWWTDDPYLYTLVTEVIENGKLLDEISTPYGIRWISWPIGKNSKQFLVNGKPVFINGIAEYEHLLGGSHAFTNEEIRARVMMIKAAGFNGFRDAHHPHNLRYQHYWDSLGIIWWTQMGAHVWFDSPAFRENFKKNLREWVKERRNSPSLALWGLQNESKLPEAFARECTAIIREMDPTTSSQRLVTTCNGGSGTDWDVPQNWTGTYGGDPNTYGEDLKKQILVGEYGAWRTNDLHSEDHSYKSNVYSEERFCALMETKIRLAESVKDSVAGHFMWLFNSHDNPGRVQAGEGYRELDRIGPVNYKGLFTPWGEPTDAFYLYRSNYVDKHKEPMVYIVSHTWPSRWTKPGLKNNIVVYSNCDEVELFNDVRAHSLGRKERNGVGTHFQWDGVNIHYNVLYAVGYVDGKEVSTDYIVLNHLPYAPRFDDSLAAFKNGSFFQPLPGLNYIYRVNCGGGNYIDQHGNTWMADRERTDQKSWGSVSWTNTFNGMPPYFASQGRTFDLFAREKDLKLMQSYRYGRENLKYVFPLPNGDYLVDMYFVDPYFRHRDNIDCTGWRTFDVAVNGKIVIEDVDPCKYGPSHMVRISCPVKNTKGVLEISFPYVASGQAFISAIAIGTKMKGVKAAPQPQPLMRIPNQDKNCSVESWLDLGDEQYAESKTTFSSLPPELFGADWIKISSTLAKDRLPVIELNRDADVFIGVDTSLTPPNWLKEFTNTNKRVENDTGYVFQIFKKRFSTGQRIFLQADNAPSAADQKFLVLAQPATNIEPAYDLKPVDSYKAVDAKWSGPGIEKGKVDGKDRVIFKAASASNVLEWTFEVGVGDMYSLQISYNNPLSANLSGKLQLLSADGTLMKEEAITFTPTREGKSNYINTTTGTMINAGKYILRLTSKDAVGLSINALDVQ